MAGWKHFRDPFYKPTLLPNMNTPKGQQLQIESTRFQNVIARRLDKFNSKYFLPDIVIMFV
jgi:hypothetical protein